MSDALVLVSPMIAVPSALPAAIMILLASTLLFALSNGGLGIIILRTVGVDVMASTRRSVNYRHGVPRMATGWWQRALFPIRWMMASNVGIGDRPRRRKTP